MKPDVLLMSRMMDTTEAALDTAYTVHRLYQAADRDAFLAEVGPKIRGIATGGMMGASTAVINALPALEIVAVNGIGTDAVDLELARSRNIRVTVTPDVLTDDVADMALALLLATLRRIVVGDRAVRRGTWQKDLPLARKVTGKRVGILGLGRIGQAIARRVSGFDMPVSYTDVKAIDGVPYPFIPDLLTLAYEVDVLIVAASGGAGSKGIVNTEVLNALGPDGVLINVARGSVVDEPALLAALADGRLGGAGLDVFAQEPNVPDSLVAMDHVVMQPHLASATVETRAAMGDLLLSNLAAHFAGKPLLTPVI